MLDCLNIRILLWLASFVRKEKRTTKFEVHARFFAEAFERYRSSFGFLCCLFTCGYHEHAGDDGHTQRRSCKTWGGTAISCTYSADKNPTFLITWLNLLKLLRTI